MSRPVVSVVGRIEDGALVTIGPVVDDVTALDVSVLRLALLNGLLPARHWLDGETTTENFARWLAAEYKRLANRR